MLLLLLCSRRILDESRGPRVVRGSWIWILQNGIRMGDTNDRLVVSTGMKSFVEKQKLCAVASLLQGQPTLCGSCRPPW
jgi:hypothetical protein